MIRFFHDNKEIDKIDFDVTDVGSINTIIIGIKNDYTRTVKIVDTKSSDPEVKILQMPSTINPSEIKEMIVSFEPSIFRKTPLELSDIGFKVLM